MTTSPPSHNMPGLMDDLVTPGASGLPPRRRVRLELRPPLFLARWWSSLQADAERRGRFQRNVIVGGAPLLLGLGIGAYFTFRDKPQPDYLESDIDNILDYTFLSDEFNNLPIKKRMELMGQLVKRLKELDSGDSELLAALAAGIKGDVRRQLEENISRLAIDAWDEKAADYEKLSKDTSPRERKEFLEKTLMDFEKMMEAVGGRERDISDEERLARMRRNSERDTKNFKEGKRPSNKDLGEFVGFMSTRMGSHASPAQQVRSTTMMRDMTRVFRGQDPSTGLPMPGGG